MDFKEFVVIMQEQMKKRTGKEVVVTKVTKNNDVKMTGLTIKETDSNLSPTIYLKPFWYQFQMSYDVDVIADRLYEVYLRDNMAHPINIGWFRNFEEVKGKVAYKLINFDKNKALLKQVPYVKYMNLAKVFYVLVEDESFGTGTILIHNRHMEAWNTSVEKLEEIAMRNTPMLCPMVLRTLKDMVEDMGRFEEEWDLKEGIYVLTNKEKHLGASAMLYANSIKVFAGLVQSDVIILPSSIHEVLLLSADTKLSVEYLCEVVREVNKKKVCPEEFLSNTVYYYDREMDSIKML